jgi:hypothetical protein
MKKIFFYDLKIHFHFNFKNNEIINLITLLKTNFIPQISIYNIQNIGCGGEYCFIFNKSYLIIFYFLY